MLLFVLVFWETCQTLLILIFSLFVIDISFNVNQSLSEGHQLTFNLFKAQRGYLILNKAMMIKKSRAHLAMQKLQQVKCTRSKWKLYRKYLPLPLPWENMHPYKKYAPILCNDISPNSNITNYQWCQQCTMCILGSMFTFQPNKLRHILKVASW